MDPDRVPTVREEIVREATAAGRVIDPEHFGLSIAYARHADELARAPRLRRRGGERWPRTCPSVQPRCAP